MPWVFPGLSWFRVGECSFIPNAARTRSETSPSRETANGHCIGQSRLLATAGKSGDNDSSRLSLPHRTVHFDARVPPGPSRERARVGRRRGRDVRSHRDTLADGDALPKNMIKLYRVPRRTRVTPCIRELEWTVASPSARKMGWIAPP